MNFHLWRNWVINSCCIPCKFPWKLTSYSWLVGHSWNPFHYFQAKNNVTKENLVSPSCSKLLLEADPMSCTKEKESEISVTALPCSIILACSSGTFWVTALIPQPLLFHILCCCGKSRPVWSCYCNRTSTLHTRWLFSINKSPFYPGQGRKLITTVILILANYRHQSYACTFSVHVCILHGVTKSEILIKAGKVRKWQTVLRKDKVMQEGA